MDDARPAGAPPAPSPQLIATWLGLGLAGLPVAFYLGGSLLTIGFFFSNGLAWLNMFSVTEIALAGWLRLAHASFLLLPAIAIAGIFAWPASTALTSRAMEWRPRLVSMLLGVVATLYAVLGIVSSRGILQAMLGALAAAMFVAFTIMFVRGTEDAVRRRLRPFRWLMLAFFTPLALGALGEATFVEAVSSPGDAILLATPAGRVCVRPLLFGVDRMIYERNGHIVLADRDGRGLAATGRRKYPAATCLSGDGNILPPAKA